MCVNFELDMLGIDPVEIMNKNISDISKTESTGDLSSKVCNNYYFNSLDCKNRQIVKKSLEKLPSLELELFIIRNTLHFIVHHPKYSTLSNEDKKFIEVINAKVADLREFILSNKDSLLVNEVLDKAKNQYWHISNHLPKLVILSNKYNLKFS